MPIINLRRSNVYNRSPGTKNNGEPIVNCSGKFPLVHTSLTLLSRVRFRASPVTVSAQHSNSWECTLVSLDRLPNQDRNTCTQRSHFSDNNNRHSWFEREVRASSRMVSVIRAHYWFQSARGQIMISVIYPNKTKCCIEFLKKKHSYLLCDTWIFIHGCVLI